MMLHEPRSVRDILYPFRNLAWRISRAALLLGVGAVFLPLILLTLPFRRRRARQLVWGPVPIINNKYWSRAMSAVGWDSVTLMDGFFPINDRGDFDLYFEDLPPRWLRPSALRKALSFYLAMAYVLRNASVVHQPFSGGPLGRTPYWRAEGWLLRLAGIRIVIIPFGADSYQYSKVEDPSLRHALLTSYPAAGISEPEIAAKVRYWTRRADAVLVGFGVDGIGRWDVTVPNPIVIDVEQWAPKDHYSPADGVDGTVYILHTPNHRGFKGTEFVISAVDRLRHRGLKLELILAEKMQNADIRTAMQRCDILVEQLIFSGYALSGVEGMASGLPVIANLQDDVRMQLYRRYAFLDECPVLSASPETIEETLELLVTRPKLREQLGGAGRKYAVKYHSYPFAQYLFGAIYESTRTREHPDLMNLFHPLRSDYVRGSAAVDHPLIRNRYPSNAHT